MANDGETDGEKRRLNIELTASEWEKVQCLAEAQKISVAEVFRRAMAEVDFILQLDKLAQDSGIQSIIDPKEFGKEDSGS